MLLSGTSQIFIQPPLIRSNKSSYKSTQIYIWLSLAHKLLSLLHLNSMLISQRPAAPTNLLDSHADDT